MAHRVNKSDGPGGEKSQQEGRISRRRRGQQEGPSQQGGRISRRRDQQEGSRDGRISTHHIQPRHRRQTY